jgi:hypothetical protein
VDAIESQNVELRELREDVKEIKSTVKELAVVAQNQAVQNQRIEGIERRTGKLETEIEHTWECIRKIDRKCLEREPVVKFGHRLMESPSHSPDDWWNLLIGSAVRNGVWIIMTGVMTTLILHYLGVRK